jgi:hypothetical protein
MNNAIWHQINMHEYISISVAVKLDMYRYVYICVYKNEKLFVKPSN